MKESVQKVQNRTWVQPLQQEHTYTGFIILVQSQIDDKIKGVLVSGTNKSSKSARKTVSLVTKGFYTTSSHSLITIHYIKGLSYDWGAPASVGAPLPPWGHRSRGHDQGHDKGKDMKSLSAFSTQCISELNFRWHWTNTSYVTLNE